MFNPSQNSVGKKYFLLFIVWWVMNSGKVIAKMAYLFYMSSGSAVVAQTAGDGWDGLPGASVLLSLGFLGCSPLCSCKH